MYIGLHIKYPLFLSHFKMPEFSQQIFKKSSNITFHENLSGELFHVDMPKNVKR